MYLFELLAESLEVEPTDRSIWKRTRGGKDTRTVLLNLVERYRKEPPEPLPSKEGDEFRPAYLADYFGRGNSPYDREFRFVSQALNYADQVAVVDDLGVIASAADPEQILSERISTHAPECDDLTWLLRRIAKYAELEQAQVLYYVDPPARRLSTDNFFDKDSEATAVNDLFELVVERMGWRPEGLPKDFLRASAAQELNMWFKQFSAVFSKVEEYHQHVDLYLPDWFAGPELLDWTYRRTLPPDWMNSNNLKNQRALSELLNLPAPSQALIERLSARELLEIRERDHMAAWRAAIRDDIHHLSVENDLASRVEIYEHLQREAESLRGNERQFLDFGKGLGEAIQAGVAVTPIALAYQQSLFATVATTVAPTLAALLSNLTSWLRGPSADPIYQGARDGVTEANALRMYLSELPGTPAEKSLRPPSSWMTTLDGRPIAMDLFDMFEER